MRREWRRTSSSQAEPSPWRQCWTSWASCSNENQPLILKSFPKAPELPHPTTHLRRLPSLALAPLERPLELPTDWALEWLSRPAKLWNVNCRRFVPLASPLGPGTTQENSHATQNSLLKETLCPVNFPGKFANLPVKPTARGTRHSLWPAYYHTASYTPLSPALECGGSTSLCLSHGFPGSRFGTPTNARFYYLE